MWRNVLFGGNVGSRARPGRLRERRLTAIVAALAALMATSLAGAPVASADSDETVIVTATGLLSPVAAVLEVGGTVVTQFHLIDGVIATIPAVAAPVLGALPGITVTADVSVTIQSAPEFDRAAHAVGRVSGPDRREPVGGQRRYRSGRDRGRAGHRRRPAA